MKPDKKKIVKILTEKDIKNMMTLIRHGDKTTTVKINGEFRIDDRDFEMLYYSYSLRNKKL